MSIDEERKNQESEPIAARANTQPRRRGPMGRGGMMPGEKAGDFKGSMLKLLAFMGKFKFGAGGGVRGSPSPRPCSTLWARRFSRQLPPNSSRVLRRKLPGTGGIRFDVWVLSCLQLLRSMVFRLVLICSGMADDPCYAKNLLSFATAYCSED